MKSIASLKTVEGMTVDLRVNNFNVIRLLAAISVLYGHAWPIMNAGSDPTARFFGEAHHYIGEMAVFFFFVISGFLLAASVEKGLPLSRFVRNRILRIFPALVVCNLVVIITCFVLFNNSFLYFTNSQTVRFFILNSTIIFHSTTSDFAKSDWLPNAFTDVAIGFANGSLWTLVAEVKAYLYMFLTLLFSKILFGTRWIFWQPYLWLSLLLISLVAFPLLPLVGMEPRFHSLFVFFFAGAALYSYRRYFTLDARIVIILAISLWICKTEAPRYYIYLAYLSYPYIVYYLAYGTKYLHTPNTIGDFSYGVYIYGWFCQNLIASYSMNISPTMNFLAGTALALLFAVPSWFLIERPALKLKATDIRWIKAPWPKCCQSIYYLLRK